MKREREADSQGGAKKFLYKKPNARSSLFGDDDDDVTTKFTFISQPPSTGNPADNILDIDQVWNIRRDVALSKNAAVSPPATCATWNGTANREFYSRHGGLAESRNLGDHLNMSNGVASTQNWGHHKQGMNLVTSKANLGFDLSPRESAKARNLENNRNMQLPNGNLSLAKHDSAFDF